MFFFYFPYFRWWKRMMSPSCTTYEVPSNRTLPSSFALFSPPAATKSANAIVCRTTI